MSINLTVPDDKTHLLNPRLTVIGVGGAGGNAVNNMIGAELEGIDFVVANTDSQALSQSGTQRRIQLGSQLTEGLGAGSRPEVGRAAAEESLDEIIAELEGAHMAFIAAGMGGGTGTGGAPVVARAAKEKGILTVGVVTKPFQFEGTHRMSQAEAGIEDLEQYVDTLIVIPNQNLFRIANEKTTFADAFAMADEVLYSGVRGVTDLMVMPGLINLDFADIRTVMSEMGKAMMGTGEAEGERRALDAAEAAIANPLLDDTSMKGAKGVLINITGGMDITLFEVDEAANRIRAEVDEGAYIIVGSAFDGELEGTMRVSVVATGIDANASQMALPTMLHLADQLEKFEPQPEVDSPPAPEMDSSIEAVMETGADPDPEPGNEISAAAGELPVEAMAYLGIETEIESVAESDTQMGDDSEELDDSGDIPIEEDDVPALVASEPVIEDTPETPPAAMPSMGATDAFIPSQPVESTDPVTADIGGEAPESEATGDPQSAPETAAEMPKPAKKISIFERVTGGSRAAFGKKVPEPTIPEKKVEDAEIKEISASKETSAVAPEGTPAPEQPVVSAPENPEIPETPEESKVAVLETVTEVGETEQTLGGLDSEDRLPTSESTDDLLDIPAFLRRQAN